MQFDVFKNPNPAARKHAPYIVDLQSEHLDHLATRLCAPAKPARLSVKPIAGLMPEIEVDGQAFHVYMQEIAAIPAVVLGARAASASQYRLLFITAVDLIVSGI